MGNKATTIEEQIALLKERGMVIDLDNQKVKEILLDIGYYRLGFYWFPFCDKEHNLNPNTKFSDIVSLYYLDVNLRNILTQYINRIEINFRTKIVYYVSNKYKSSPTWFIDPKIVSPKFIKDIDKHYSEDFKKSNKTIKLHHKKYLNDKYAPAWKTLEFFSFGTILKIYKNLIETDIKERISRFYGVKDIHKFINFMETIVLIRNICAHSAVLYDFKTPKGISSIPAISFEDRDRHSIYPCIKVISYILGVISETRQIEMNDKLKNLFLGHKNNEVISKIIENEIKFKF